MADVKWIKLATNIFDNRKIRQIETLPDGNAVIIVWLKLLCLAGSINDAGMVYFTKEIPYTDQMMAAQFNMPLSTVQLAISTFEQFGMLDVEDNILHIANWEKYQSIDRLNEIREYNRLAQQKSRAKRKALQSVNDSQLTSQRCHETDIDKDIDKDKEEDKGIILEKPKETRHKYGLYNNVLLSDADLEELKTEFTDWEQRIERLSEYIASKGKSYENHLATIRAWARKDNQQRKVGANGIALSNQQSDLEGVF